MKLPERYQEDILFYFDGKPRELALYQALFHRLEAAFPDASARVQKSQISFYGRHLFAMVSLPARCKKDWPRECILVTFGLPCRVDLPRIAVATEPYPGRWTHHVVVSREEEVDEELIGLLEGAWGFSEGKR